MSASSTSHAEATQAKWATTWARQRCQAGGRKMGYKDEIYIWSKYMCISLSLYIPIHIINHYGITSM